MVRSRGDGSEDLGDRMGRMDTGRWLELAVLMKMPPEGGQLWDST